MPIWCLLFGHMIVFTLTGVIHPVAILQMGILVAWIVAFLSGTGVYFSTRFRHTTTAVIANFALAGVIWVLVPIILAMVIGTTRGDMDVVAGYIDTHPFVQTGVVIDGATRPLGTYYWPGKDSLNAGESTFWLLTCMAGYMFVGYLFMWRARFRLRRNVF